MEKTIEKKAMDIVMKFERRKGLKPIDVSKERRGYDIKSGKKCIEVKGTTSKRATWVTLNRSLLRKIGAFFNNYYIYIVYDINNKAKLKIIDSKYLFKNLEVATSLFISTKSVNAKKDTPLKK